jgi:hypothetical protein
VDQYRPQTRTGSVRLAAPGIVQMDGWEDTTIRTFEMNFVVHRLPREK